MLKKEPRKNFIVKAEDKGPRKVINLDGGDPMIVDQEIGTLIIIILKAKNLNDNHFRKQDVFAQVTLNGNTKKTQVDIRAGQHPLWDVEIRYPIMKSTKAKHRKLEVACYADEPRPLPDQLLGQATVDLSDTLKSGEFDEWIDLSVDGVQRGEIYIEMTYYSKGPAPSQPPPTFNNKLLANVLGSDPLQRRPSKLSPNERLSRPNPPSGPGPGPAPSKLGPYPQGEHTKPTQQQPYSYVPTPSSLKPAAGISHARSDAVPPPDITSNPPLPSLLRPGGDRRTSPSSPVRVHSANYGHQRLPTSPPSPQTQYYNSQYGNSPGYSNDPNPYIAESASPSPAPGPNPYVAQQRPILNLAPTWRPDAYNFPPVESGTHGPGGFAIMSPAHTTQNPDWYPQPQQVGYAAGRPEHVRGNSDPALIMRYSTPLPLPPGAAAPRISQPAAPVAFQMPGSFPSNVPMLPPKDKPPSPDGGRIDALRRAEEDAKRRHEQELRDLEIAMRLDRELNLS